MKPRHLLLGAALLVAAGLAVFGDKTPGSGLAEAVLRAPPAAARVAVAPPKTTQAPIVRLIPRAELLADSADPAGQGENVFLPQDWTPPPPKQLAPPAATVAPPPPSAPPLPFSYLGKAVSEGSWEVYLARADKTYIVRNNIVIDGLYRVDAIAPPTLTLTYLPLNQVQQLNIGVTD